MRIKSCILFALGCLLVGSAKADVTAIRLRFGQDGTLTDIGTSLTSASMALSSPVVEPDGSVTNPEQIALASEEETDALFLTPAAAENETDQATCASVNGNYKTYHGDTYCCSTSTSIGASMAGLIYENGAWSSNVLMPQCGCYGSDVYVSMRTEQEGNSTYYVCCQEHNQVESNSTGAGGAIIDKGESPLCYCPDQAKKGGTTYNVVELSNLDFVEDQNLYCCAGNYRLQTATVVSDNPDDYCKCYNDSTRENCTETACRKLGYNWCGEAGCSAASCGCDENEQETSDGRCIPCPASEGGRITLSGGLEVCCRPGEIYTSKNDEHVWVSDIVSCSCPAGTTLQNDVCCDKNNLGTFLGMTTSTEDKDKAIRLCGCRTGETPSSLTEEVCCGDDDKKIKRSTSNMGTLTEADAPRYCGCQSGEYSSKADECVPCVTDTYCESQGKKKCLVNTSDPEQNRCVMCRNFGDCDSNQICAGNECKSCASPTPYYDNGVCYECLDDTHCGNGKVCNPNDKTCVTCVLYTEIKSKNKGCNPEGQKPYCVQMENGPGCSECKGDADCTGKYPDLVHCLREKGICSADCGDNVEVNPETGECNCSGTTPVFNILTKKCVTCYNSISGAWTDLGCNKVDKKIVEDKPEHSPWNYSPWQAPKGKYNNRDAPVCWESGNGGDGQCVECTDNDQCVGQKICNSDHTCSCPSDRPNYQPTTKRCLACDANNGASSGTRCGATKPKCVSGECTCEENYSTPKNNGDGKCPQNNPLCSDGQCTTCPSGQAYSTPEKKCIPCASGFSVNSSGVCSCPVGKWKKSDTDCRNCPTNGSCTTENDTTPCASGKSLNSGETACVQCTAHTDCDAGKYCKNNSCVKCGVGFECGCGSYKCANGNGGCFTQLQWCTRWNSNYSHDPSENSACNGYRCCNHNSRDHVWNGGNPPNCSSCSSGSACRG